MQQRRVDASYYRSVDETAYLSRVVRIVVIGDGLTVRAVREEVVDSIDERVSQSRVVVVGAGHPQRKVCLRPVTLRIKRDAVGHCACE